MQMNASRPIAATRAAVWAALTDPAMLWTRTSGCESLDMTWPVEMTAKPQVVPLSAVETEPALLVEPVANSASQSGKGWFEGPFGKADVIAPLILLAVLGFAAAHACCLDGSSMGGIDALNLICSGHSAS